MPPLASTASLSAPRRVTDVVSVFEAGSISPCRAGDKVALHVYTTKGEIIIRLSERNFILGCRGERDANGNPFRTVAQLDESASSLRDAPFMPEVSARSAGGFPPSEDLRERNEKAWGLFTSGAALTTKRAAELAGVSYQTLTQYIRLNHADEARVIRRERRYPGLGIRAPGSDSQPSALSSQLCPS